MKIANKQELKETVSKVVQEQKITDVHTHLYSPNFGDILLWDIDELLTYHYLVAEVMRWSDLPINDFWKLSKREQADHIWEKLFIEHSPVSEAAQGVLTTLKSLGLDVASRDLNAYREYFAKFSATEQVNQAMEVANVDNIVMTNDPFDERERQIWLNGTKPETRFHAALRIDPLLNDYQNTKAVLRERGYEVSDAWDEQSINEVKRFLNDWISKMDPLYMAVSLPPTFAYPEESDRGRIIRDCILPVANKAGIPFAMMIGVKKRVHPEYGDAGDFVGKADVAAVENLLRENPENKFLVTMLSRENQHELVVLARKFSNLMIFGCWWFMNNPSIVDEITRMRTEMLGTSYIPQHSDARVLEQIIYKWQHSKNVISNVLIEQYEKLLESGWELEKSEIERDVADLFSDNFWKFLGKK